MTARIIAYKTIARSQASALNELVNQAISEGFQPIGSVKIDPSVAITDHASKDLYESGSMYVQTMVMYEGAVISEL